MFLATMIVRVLRPFGDTELLAVDGLPEDARLALDADSFIFVCRVSKRRVKIPSFPGVTSNS